MAKNRPTKQETGVQSLGCEDLLGGRRGEWIPTPAFLPREFHGQRSLVGYSSWSDRELDMTEWLTHTQTYTISLSIWLPKWCYGKEHTCQCRRHKRPLGREDPLRRAHLSTPIFLPGKSYGQRSLPAMVYRIAKSCTQLKWLSTQACTLYKIDKYQEPNV